MRHPGSFCTAQARSILWQSWQASWFPHPPLIIPDYFHISPGRSARGDFGQFGAPQARMEASYDTAFAERLGAEAGARGIQAGSLGERKLDHGTMVPLYFVNQYWTEYRLVRVGLSGLPLTAHYRLGQCIREAAQALDRRAVIIASGDLSHRLKEDGPYGYREEGPAYDARIMDVMARAAFGELLEFSEDFCEKAAECGHRSFTILAGAFDRTAVEPQKLSYEGPFGVGYGVCRYKALGPDGTRDFLEQHEEKEKARLRALREREDPYVRLARQTIREYVRTGRQIAPPQGLPPELYGTRAGAFVSLKEDGRLRAASAPSRPRKTAWRRKSSPTPSAPAPGTPGSPWWRPGRQTASPSAWTCWGRRSLSHPPKTWTWPATGSS